MKAQIAAEAAPTREVPVEAASAAILLRRTISRSWLKPLLQETLHCLSAVMRFTPVVRALFPGWHYGWNSLHSDCSRFLVSTKKYGRDPFVRIDRTDIIENSKQKTRCH